MKACQIINLVKNELQVDGKLFEKLPSDVYSALHKNMFYELHFKLNNVTISINRQLMEENGKGD